MLFSGLPSPARKRHCSSSSCPDYVARYASYLKEKYRRLSVFPDRSEWPPSVGNFDTQVALIEHQQYPQNSRAAAADMSDIVVGGVDRILARKQIVMVEKIFSPSDTAGNELKILIDGAPGVGKTTLTRRFVKDWAEGKLLSMYDLVVLLPLRERRIAQGRKIRDLFYHDDSELREQTVKHVCSTMGANIMLILDGFDELSQSQRKEGSLLLNIICGEELLHCSVIVTSRPFASETIQKSHCLTRHVEVLGFTDQQIQHCITSSYLDAKQAQNLVQMLQERQDLTSLCYIPLNCAIMIFIYKHQSFTLPDTLTQLYEMFLVNVLKRHADKYDEDLGKRVRNLDRLPGSLQACLTALSKLAFKSLEDDQSTFYIEEMEAELSEIDSIAPENDLPSKLLGLMNVFQSTSGAGIEESYQFLHRTIQEFLAAKYASCLPANDQVTIFKKYILSSNTVAVFQAGLSKLSNPVYYQYFKDEVSFSFLLNEEYHELPDFYQNYDAQHFHQYLHALYEAQNIELCKILPKCVASQQIGMMGVRLSPFHCRVLAYCLINSGCSWKCLDLSRCNLTETCLQAFGNMKLPETDCGSVEELIFSENHHHFHTSSCTNDNMFTFAGLSLIPSVPLFKNVQVLKLKAPCLIPNSALADGFAKLLQMKNLASLSFHPTKIERFMSNKEFILLHNIQHIKCDLESELLPCKLLEHPTNVSPSLQTLNIAIPETSDCTTMKNIAISLKESKVSNLQLCTCLASPLPVGASISVMFPSFLSMKTIQTLSLTLRRVHVPHTTDIQIPVTELEGLQIMLQSSETLKHLNLDIDCMIEADVQYLAKGLSVNKALTSLSVLSGDRGTLTFADFDPIYKALQKKVNLEEFDLRGPSSSNRTDKTAEGGLYALQEALKLNVGLQDLRFSGVGDSELKFISEGLINHPSLDSVLLIIDQVLQVPSVLGLRALQSCPALQSIGVYGGLTAFGLWVQDGVTGGHWDIQCDTSCLDVGILIGELFQRRFLPLRLDFFSHLLRPCMPVLILPDWIPDTRLIVEGLSSNLLAHHLVLKDCGFAKLHFEHSVIIALIEFEAVADDATHPDPSLLPMQWESVDHATSFERIRTFQEEEHSQAGEGTGEVQQWTAYIGMRLRMEFNKIDLLLKVINGESWTQHLRPGECFVPIQDSEDEFMFN